ncbi:hypothetical protein QBC40DRAFT_277306 [Triangularia verruculosa]|uniref:Uncharacterized protein n=1 Tax=Triangularia verruculosa TaxID=2587418 RepID=A0AAN7AUX0_9PEZI|nr:hypothetical protein QBC40DRAFT_277306 [Triangularia verruculosa]
MISAAETVRMTAFTLWSNSQSLRLERASTRSLNIAESTVKHAAAQVSTRQVYIPVFLFIGRFLSIWVSQTTWLGTYTMLTITGFAINVLALASVTHGAPSSIFSN